jgi:hypothetical protein
MPANPAPKGRTPLLLTSTQERILQLVHFLRFATAQEITHAQFSKGSLTYIRAILSRLAGGKDYKTREFLYRFPLPAAHGAKERVFCLGAKGREALKVEDYDPPHKIRQRSYGQLLHDLTLSRFVASTLHYCRTSGTYRLREIRTCYELSRNPPCFTQVTNGQEISITVIPDAWVHVKRVADGKAFPLWIEIDRGTMFRKRYQQLMAHRLTYFRSGEYEKMFGTPALRIVYLTTGSTPDARYTRLHTLRRWTEEVLSAQQLTAWTPLFRFAPIVFEQLYDHTHHLFSEPEWYQPDDTDDTVPLFDPIVPTTQPAGAAGRENAHG